MLNTVGSGLTRRNFLKASAIAAGGAWAGNLVTTAKACARRQDCQSRPR